MVVVALAVVLLTVFVAPIALFVALPVAIVLGIPVARHLRGRPVAVLWLAAAASLALGCLERAWRDSLHGPFLWCAAAGGTLLVAAAILLPVVARDRAGWMIASGLALMVIGFVTVWIGIGLVLLPLGLLLYVAGMIRGRLLPWPFAVGAAVAALLAVAASQLDTPPVVAVELAVAGVLALAAGLYVRASDEASRW